MNKSFFRSFCAAAFIALIITSCSKKSPTAANPKIKDLGVVEVSTGKPIRADMGDNKTCVIVPTVITNGGAKFVKMKITIEIPDTNGTVKELACPSIQAIAGESAEVQVGDVGIRLKTKI